MGKINVMNETLANKIAAGEVVERIANVVKELVENSIDAGSTNVKIELVESGTKSIKIIDNGSGMSASDAVLCFSRHATSKIKNENDLYFINTLGFRGEALAAISSVADVTLDTYDGNEATKVHIEYGKLHETCQGSMRQGTIIEVKNLFYNVPARLKFMKSLTTELNLCVSYMEKISLSHPEVSFTLINNQKEIFKTSGSNDIYKTIHEIYGYNTTKNMIKVEAENYDYMLSGYVSNINIQKSNKNNMITLVNGRVVTNASVNRTIKDAYHTVLADNKYPVVVLYIETDPTLIDVNIHPTKQDIKFSKLESLNDLLFNTIRNAINESDNVFKAYKEEKKELILPDVYSLEEKEEVKETKQIETIRLNLSVEEETPVYNEEEIKKENTFIKPVGLALGTYLIAHDEDIMYMIDIHAANERINYEKYKKSLEEQSIYKTNMLFPICIEYPKNEYLKLMDNIDFIKSLGFELDEFGNNTVRITSHPTWLKEGYEEESINKIFDLIIEMSDKFDRVKFNDSVSARLACKMSVKANTNISYQEQEELINRLFKCDFPYTCPHGRPTIIKYPIYELEKLFKRVNS